MKRLANRATDDRTDATTRAKWPLWLEIPTIPADWLVKKNPDQRMNEIECFKLANCSQNGGILWKKKESVWTGIERGANLLLRRGVAAAIQNGGRRHFRRPVTRHRSTFSWNFFSPLVTSAYHVSHSVNSRAGELLKRNRIHSVIGWRNGYVIRVEFDGVSCDTFRAEYWVYAVALTKIYLLVY